MISKNAIFVFSFSLILLGISADIPLEKIKSTYKEIKRKITMGNRSLQSTPLILTECTNTFTQGNYSWSSNLLKRTQINKVTGENFFMFNWMASDGITKNYDLQVQELKDGLLFFGFCNYNFDNSKVCGRGTGENAPNFFGIGIHYFGPECFSIDYYYRDQFIISGKNCVSSNTIKGYKFTAKSDYISSPKIKRFITISINGQIYYKTDDLMKPKTGALDDYSLENTNYYPCFWMYLVDTCVKIDNFQ